MITENAIIYDSEGDYQDILICACSKQKLRVEMKVLMKWTDTGDKQIPSQIECAACGKLLWWNEY